MRKTIVTAAILFGFLFQQLNAQSLGDFKKMTANQKAKMLTDSLQTMLVLSNQQYGQVYTTLLDGATKATPIMNGDESRRSKRQKLTAIGQQIEDKLKIELSSQQFALYQTKKEKLITYYRDHLQADKLVFNVPDN